MARIPRASLPLPGGQTMTTWTRRLAKGALGLAAGAALVLGFSGTGVARQAVPDPAVDAPHAAAPGLRKAVFAGGCFWGIEAVYEHVKGVRSARSGYSGGAAATAHYAQVSNGDTGHAESVEVTYDPSKVSYGQLLKVFFSVAHDPTQLNRQGPDRGTQYRSAIFYADPEQERVAKAYIAQMTAAHTFGRAPIVTQVVPLRAFYPAEPYHQDYARLNPNDPYIVFNDAPKVEHLRERLPALYR
jgi:peptide-methionine (S)-S-oxide reductase